MQSVNNTNSAKRSAGKTAIKSDTDAATQWLMASPAIKSVAPCADSDWTKGRFSKVRASSARGTSALKALYCSVSGFWPLSTLCTIRPVASSQAAKASLKPVWMLWPQVPSTQCTGQTTNWR